jgi:hypothetical protein
MLFVDVFFVTHSMAVVLGIGHFGLGIDLYWTSDGGTNWAIRPTGTSQNLKRLFFTDALTGWAVGDDGTILHTTNGGLTFVDGERRDGVPTEFALAQNYPNPFNPSTTIRYALPHTSFVTLTVYNTLGQQVAQLVNEQQQAGYHDVVFRGDGLASGVYFYRIQAGSYVDVKKLILFK